VTASGGCRVAELLQLHRLPAIITGAGRWQSSNRVHCACRLAYDGKGNAVVREVQGAAAAVDSLGGYGQGLYAERWAPYVKVGRG